MTGIRSLLFRAFALLVVTSVIVVGCGPRAPATLTKIVFVQAHTDPIAGEDSPMYAIPQEFGYFKQEGLEVEWQFSKGSAEAIQLLLAGNAQLANANAESVFTTRSQGGPVKAVFAVKGRSGYYIGLLPDSPVQKLEDLKGKTIGVSTMGSAAVPIITSALADVGLQKDTDYQMVAAGSGAQAAAAITGKKVDALGLWDSAYAVVENQGIKLRYIDMPIQAQLAPYTLAATDDYIKQHPDIIKGFCRAWVKGFTWAIANPQGAVAIFYKYFPASKPSGIPEATAIQQDAHVVEAWMVNASKFQEPLWGQLYPEKWAFGQQYYTKLGLIKQQLDPTQYYTNDFVKACNDFNKDALREQAKKYVIGK